MALKELVGDGSGVIKQTRTGSTCRREFVGLWGDTVPYVGSAHPLDSRLIAETVDIEPFGAVTASEPVGTTEQIKVVVEYVHNYLNPKLGDPPRISYQTISEALMTGQGRVWDDCGEKIEAEDFSAATTYTMIRWTVDMAVAAIPIQAIRSVANHVNDSEWQGIPAGRVLFEECNAQAEYDWETSSWYFRVQLTFLERDRPHNEIYRGAIPRRRNGSILYYQNEDPSDDVTYKTDAELVDHPVPKAGTAGTAGWTTTTPKTYEEADFAVVF